MLPQIHRLKFKIIATDCPPPEADHYYERSK
jgi:hypothetical protein